MKANLENGCGCLYCCTPHLVSVSPTQWLLGCSVPQKLILGLSKSGYPAKKKSRYGNQAKARRPRCPWAVGILACVNGGDPAHFPFPGQVGLIQLGQEQVLIQPVNNSQGSLGGQEHLIRRKWSLTPSPSVEAQLPRQLCKVLTGESGGQRGGLATQPVGHHGSAQHHPLLCCQML